MASTWDAGDQLVTADIVLGVSGKPVRVFNMTLISGGTASVIALRDGTSASGTIRIQETGTISTGKTFDYGVHGHYFPNGCFVDVDANITSAMISYSQG
jgi:hypothetical protein